MQVVGLLYGQATMQPNYTSEFISYLAIFPFLIQTNP